MFRALALLCLPLWAHAFGGTQVSWLGGTLPYDTVPFLEADPQLLFSAGSGAPTVGAALQAGLTDWWMVQGAYVAPMDGGPSASHALSRMKLMPQPVYGFSGAAYGGAWMAGGAAVDWGGGLIAGWEGASQSLFVNKAIYQSGESLSVGYWAPYPVFMLRPGLEAGIDERGPVSRSWWMPQVAFNFPGDLSLDLGVRLQADGSGDYRVFSRLSYQLFPNP